MEVEEQPEIVEDRALKKILRPNDYQRDVAIPRAQVKRFPSNVSKFRRSASARYPSRSFAPPVAQPQAPTRTIPIDIATLDVGPPPKIPVRREIGRSYSNRSNDIRDFRRPLRQTSVESDIARPNGGGSFLYSGNYDPNHPNRKIVTKPVPLARSQSMNYKDAQPRPQPRQSPAKNVNPLAVGRSMIIMEDDGEDEDIVMAKDNQFDNWASDLYNKNGGAVVVRGVPVENKKAPDNKAGPSKNFKKPAFQLAAMAKDVADDEAQKAVTEINSGGDLDLGDLREGFVTGMGGKLGGKLGRKMSAKLGGKLGNEKLGGELVGDALGETATDMAKDEVIDLASGEGLSPPEVPDPAGCLEKCTIM